MKRPASTTTATIIYRAALARMSYLYNKENKVEGKAMCYGIREFTGKKTREGNIVQRTGSPEMSEHSKRETMVRTWLKKWVHKGSARDKKERPVPCVCGALSMLQRLALSLLMVATLAQAGGCSIHIGGGFRGHGFHGHHGFGFRGLFGHKFLHHHGHRFGHKFIHRQ